MRLFFLELEDVLVELVVCGCVSCDSFVGLWVLMVLLFKCSVSKLVMCYCMCWLLVGIEDVGCWFLICL